MLIDELGPNALLNPDWVDRWMRMGTGAPDSVATDAPGPVATDIEVVARLLELVAVTDGIVEACKVIGVRDTKSISQEIRADVVTLAEHFTGYNPEAVFTEHARLVESIQKESSGEAVKEFTALLEQLVYATRVLVAACPIARLRERARTPELYDWFERLQRAREVLRGFLLRNDPEEDQTRNGVATAYQEGRITLSQAAEYLGMRPGDAAATLDSLGMCREPEKVTLSDTDRKTLLARIRAQRLEANQSPERARDLARRSAISSMRLEGVDARSWIPPKRA